MKNTNKRPIVHVWANAHAKAPRNVHYHAYIFATAMFVGMMTLIYLFPMGI